MRKNVKGSRLLAMLLALTLMLGMMPCAFASASGIAVTSIADGEVVEAGTNVSLQAEWDFADVERIDFYANGEKLPGFITSEENYVLWQSPVAGAYEVKAVATFVSETYEESEPVKIYVKPADALAVLYTDADMADWYSNNAFVNAYDNMKPVGDSAWGGYSLSFTPQVDYFMQYFKSLIIPSDKKYLNLQVYVDGIPDVLNGKIHLVSKLEYYNASAQVKNISTRHNVYNGWNTLSIDVSSIQGLEMIKLHFYRMSSGQLKYHTDINAEDIMTQEQWIACTVLANGLYYSDSIIDAEGLTAAPAVPDGKAGVCNELGKYRISFNRPLADNMTEDDLAGSVTIAAANGTVEGTSVVRGADFIDVVIPEGSLALNTEYTVTVAKDKVIDLYGNYYAGGSFKFTTIENGCTGAQPIPSVTYPKDGSTVAADSQLSASVIFSGNVSKVEFVAVGDSETVLTGTVDKFGREYTLVPDAGQLTAGNTYTVKARATTTENEVFESDTVEFTVGVSKTTYSLVGIENGDNIMINDNLGKTVYVIDENAYSRTYDGKENSFKVKTGAGTNNGASTADATYINPEVYATGIAKVVYYLNGKRAATVTEAPYAAELDTKKIGENTLVAEIYDELGTVTTIERSFTAAYGYVASSYNEDFEGENPVVPETMVSKFPDVTFVDATDTNNDERKQEIASHNGSMALGVYSGRGYTYANCLGTKKVNHSNIGLWPEALNVTAGTSRVFLEFDYSADMYSHNIHYIALEDAFKLSKGDNAKYGVIVLPKDLLQGTAKNNFKTTRIGLDIEWDANDSISWKVYLNGKETYRQSTDIMYDTTVDPKKLTPVLAGNQISVWNYIDNIRVAAYSIPDEDVVGVASQQRSFTENAAAQITVVNKSLNPVDIFNFVAVYDNETGKLVGATPYEIDLEAETVYENDYPVKVEDGQTAKIFTWFKDGLKPVTLK